MVQPAALTKAVIATVGGAARRNSKAARAAPSAIASKNISATAVKEYTELCRTWAKSRIHSTSRLRPRAPVVAAMRRKRPRRVVGTLFLLLDSMVGGLVRQSPIMRANDPASRLMPAARP